MVRIGISLRPWAKWVVLPSRALREAWSGRGAGGEGRPLVSLGGLVSEPARQSFTKNPADESCCLNLLEFDFFAVFRSSFSIVRGSNFTSGRVRTQTMLKNPREMNGLLILGWKESNRQGEGKNRVQLRLVGKTSCPRFKPRTEVPFAAGFHFSLIHFSVCPLPSCPLPSSFILHLSSFIFHPSSLILHPSSFILHPSSFIPHPSSLILHPSSFIPHPSSFILHPSSFILHPSSLIAKEWHLYPHIRIVVRWTKFPPRNSTIGPQAVCPKRIVMLSFT